MHGPWFMADIIDKLDFIQILQPKKSSKQGIPQNQVSHGEFIEPRIPSHVNLFFSFSESHGSPVTKRTDNILLSVAITEKTDNNIYQL